MKAKETPIPRKVPLEAGEEVLKAGSANMTKTGFLGFFGVNNGGKLFVTNKRVIFETLVGSGFNALDLSDIHSASKALTKIPPLPIGIIPNSFNVRNKSGGVLAHFVSWGRAEWVDTINKAIRGI